MGDPQCKATRDGFGEGLLEAGRANPRVVALSGDMADSTRAEWFKKEFPDRYIEMGIAEQNLVGAAAGLALAGKIPFACTFSAFLTGRAWEQIRISVCYQQANVKLMGSHGGFSPGLDGATAETLEELTLMRVLPGMTVLVPADAEEARKAAIAAAAHEGPVFIRCGRNAIPIITRRDDPFEIGRMVQRRAGDDVTLVACGAMVALADVAAARLAKQGVEARVINCHTLKPLDTAALLAAAQETGALVTVEEHSVTGGLGSAVAEYLSEACPVPIRMVGVRNAFGQSGPPDVLWEAYGLTPEAIVEAAEQAVKAKHKTVVSR